MTGWQIGLAAWGALSVLLALTLGRIIHRREEAHARAHHDAELERLDALYTLPSHRKEH